MRVAVSRVPAGTTADQPGWAFGSVVVNRPQHRPLVGAHAQAGLAKRVEVQARAALVLRDQQVGPAVGVQVAHRATALLAKNLDAAAMSEHGRKPATPVAEQ